MCACDESARAGNLGKAFRPKREHLARASDSAV
jgi:hypothetical protein